MLDSKIAFAAVLGGAVGGVVSLSAYCLWIHGSKKKIARLHTEDPRFSAIIKYIYNDTITGLLLSLCSLVLSLLTMTMPDLVFSIVIIPKH